MPASDPPKIVVIAGCNGAGKSTIARTLLPVSLRVLHFVNADLIAAGLSPFDPALVDFQAGRLMLRRIRELAAARESFAFETTLSSRSYAPFLVVRRGDGY